MRAWRERADLQAARQAVFRARVVSATRALAWGKLRRSLGRWQEVHSSAQVAVITRLRAEGHARRKILGRFWRGWISARDLQVTWRRERWALGTCVLCSIGFPLFFCVLLKTGPCVCVWVCVFCFVNSNQATLERRPSWHRLQEHDKIVGHSQHC